MEILTKGDKLIICISRRINGIYRIVAYTTATITKVNKKSFYVNKIPYKYSIETLMRVDTGKDYYVDTVNESYTLHRSICDFKEYLMKENINFSDLKQE